MLSIETPSIRVGRDKKDNMAACVAISDLFLFYIFT